MIIKKKYTSIKKVIDEVPEEDTLSVIDDAVQAYEHEAEEESGDELFEDEEQFENNEEAPVDIEEEPQENIEPEEEQKRTDIDDLDLSLENIRFEQREERREGTRRRGYRRSQDRNIVTRAQQEALSIRDAARQEGRLEGIQSAQNEIAEIRDKLSEFFDCKQEVFDKISGCILDIALEAAKKIIGKEVEENKEYIIPMIKNLIEDIDKTENKIMLKVMPKDAEIVKDKIDEILDTKYFEAQISVIPDNSIKDGGVILETSNGIIDASISTSLSIMEQVLKKKEAQE